jgi:predicted HTH transcriptional regulator
MNSINNIFRKPTKAEIEELYQYESEAAWEYDPYCGLSREEMDHEIWEFINQATIAVTEIDGTKIMMLIGDLEGIYALSLEFGQT